VYFISNMTEKNKRKGDSLIIAKRNSNLRTDYEIKLQNEILN